jgi:hypothetical protein
MSSSGRHIPQYRQYKPKDLAVVRIDGRDYYLGKYNSEESREKYHRLIAEWLTNGRQTQPIPSQANEEKRSLSVNDVILAYWRFAKQHYVRKMANLPEFWKGFVKHYAHSDNSTATPRLGSLALKSSRPSAST